MKFRIKRHLHGNRFLLRKGASPNQSVSFLIDRTGMFRLVQVLDRRRSWALPLAWFWDFTLLECEISPGTMMTIGELDEALKPLKKSGHFPTAGQFHRFLRGHAPDDLFDEAKFRQFWEKHEPRLSDSEWAEQYP